MQVIECPRQFQQSCLKAREKGELGLVPTMGFLHEGHQSLIREAVKHRSSALSIFVNPTQFGPKEDLSRYPRDLERDLEIARDCGVDLVFVPNPENMYPQGFDTWIEVGELADTLEGEHRPGHFRGIATVVLKLLNLAQCSHAYFGEKDFQQLAIIRRMVRDLDLPCRITALPTVRESDGLALSSRNAYLSAEDRQRALCLSRGLNAAQDLLLQGERDPLKLESAAREQVAVGADSIDYVALRDVETLREPEEVAPGKVVLLIAARVGNTRLIDNRILGKERFLIS